MSEVKKYVNPKRFSVIIENTKGEEVKLTASPMSIKLLRKIEEMEAVEDGKEKDENSTIIAKRMVLIFGNNEEFYDDFDLNLITSVVNDFNTYAENPTRKTLDASSV